MDNIELSDQVKSIISSIERNFGMLSTFEQYKNDNTNLRNELSSSLDQLHKVKTDLALGLDQLQNVKMDLAKTHEEKNSIFLQVNNLTETLENNRS